MKIMRSNLSCQKLCVILLICFLLLPICTSADTLVKNNDKAQKLNKLGLFLGGDNGFELDKNLTRAAGTVMVLRIMGVENQAAKYELKSNFIDSSGWAEKYISYSQKNGIVTGIGNLFKPNDIMTPRMYIALVLRCLGHDTKESWDNAFSIAEEVGLINSLQRTDLEEKEINKQFLRDDLVLISYNALSTRFKNNQQKTLLDDLIEKKVVKIEDLYEVDAQIIPQMGKIADPVVTITPVEAVFIVPKKPDNIGKPALTKEELGDVELVQQIENIKKIWDDLKQVEMTDPLLIEENIIVEDIKK